MSKQSIFCAAVITILAVSVRYAFAARFDGSEVTFVAHHSDKNVPAKDLAWNKFDSAVVVCKRINGCLLSIAASVGWSYADESMAVKSVVDGEERANPKKPLYSDAGCISTRQNVIVTPGRHTIETKAYVVNAGNVGPWEVDYTLYQGVRDHDDQ